MAFLEEAPFESEAYLDAKSHITEADNGDLIIEGYASNWSEDDQDEMFEPGAFDKGIKSFLETNPVLLYHHNGMKVLGQVTDLTPDEHGLRMKARVEKPVGDAGWGADDVYAKIKSGTTRGLSVAGKFRRRLGRDGKVRIHEAGLREISVTPLPVHPTTMFRVASKAFEASDPHPLAETIAGLQGAVRQYEALANTLEELHTKHFE